jgi:hypothetical protein
VAHHIAGTWLKRVLAPTPKPIKDLIDEFVRGRREKPEVSRSDSHLLKGM